MNAAGALLLDGARALLIRPIQPTIGAEIAGVDLRNPISDAIRDQIKAAVLCHKVVFFRDQDITLEQHAAFAARFGKLYSHPNIPGHERVKQIHKIAVPANMPTIDPVDAPSNESTRVVARFHTDTSWRLVPTWGAVLRAVCVPDVGGDTVWVDGEAAYQGLPNTMKRRFEDLHVAHDARSACREVGQDYPIVCHPLVRTHRETGKKILWVNFAQNPCILGIDLSESRKLLTLVLDQYRELEYQVRFQWRANSIAFWDNRATVHCGVSDYNEFPRELDRALIEDDASYRDL